MFNSTVLETAIGLVFCFASVALITSSIYEALASWLGLRSKALLGGVEKLLNDDAGNGLLLGIYNHALAHPTGNGLAMSIADLRSRPSYIDPKHFAIALIETIQPKADSFAQLGDRINAIPDMQLRQLLRGMHDRANGSMEHLHAQVADWFDAAMDRVSGSYKRQSQLWCFLIALGFAAMFNVDSIHLFATLWQHPALVAQITATAPASATALQGLNVLPIGWQTTLPLYGFGASTILGWFITATAALFGAPFWFDLLQQFIRIRGGGPKPKPGRTV